MLTPVDARSRRLDVSVRPERDDAVEVAAITSVVAAAFGSTVEADLVAAIRKSGNLLPGPARWSPSTTARSSGHVMVSHVTLDGPAGERPVASLAPLAVVPEAQRRGIGSTLVRAVLAVCERAGEPLVVLEGSPEYYSRLGFEPAARMPIRAGGSLRHHHSPARVGAARGRPGAPLDELRRRSFTGTVVYPTYFPAG